MIPPLAPGSGSLAVPEPVRERETFKYDDLGFSFDLPSPCTDSIPPELKVGELCPSPDGCLTAFAQLGLYRMEATNVKVSLFDRSYQHILAEAVLSHPYPPTKQSTELPPSPTSPTYNLSFSPGPISGGGASAIPRSSSLCEHVLTGRAEDATVPGSEDGSVLPVSVVENVWEDERFSHIVRPARGRDVKENKCPSRSHPVDGGNNQTSAIPGPNNQQSHEQGISRDDIPHFYAGVPIRTPTGVNIGVYCITSDHPRPQGLSADQVQFAREISKTVMDYLEARRSGEWYRRGERMVRGLGSFVQGEKSLRGHRGSEDFTSSGGVRGPSEEAETLKPKKPPRRKLTGVSQLKSDVDNIFAKAANVIREAVEVDGVVFLDASVKSFGGLIGMEVQEPPILARVSCNHSSPGSTRPSSPIIDHSPLASSSDEEDNPPCPVLGFSTPHAASVHGDHLPAAFPERLMQMLLNCRNRGQIWSFEPDGSMIDPHDAGWSTFARRDSTPSSPSATKATSTSRRRCQYLSQALQRSFPDAKSIAFFPLFDAQKHRWFAAGFAWTKRPTRTFSIENELSYLRVFGLIAMAEVSRLHTVAADRTKTDILGSISHELRSPLHGVVGAVELLRGMGLGEGQEAVVRGIEMSGRCLLDTIDHLLDYSRISNQISRTKSERRASVARPGSGARRASMISGSSTAPGQLTVQLDQLVEEVVESVLAGWSYRNRDDAGFAAWRRKEESGRAGNKTRPGPRPADVILDVEPGNWSFSTHPGAFRRIVMNLLGNSLKFTEAGYIRIRLFQAPDHGDKGRTRTVVLVISDTGKGMGKDYIEQELFSPFSQEDPFAPGTGLGLSLVRQMAITLGGNIDISSFVGKGTTVKVSLPLPISTTVDGGETSFQENVKALHGARVLLRGFRTDLPSGLLDDEHKQKSQLQQMQDLCRDWLHLTVMRDGTEDLLTPQDFVIWSYTPENKEDEIDTPRNEHQTLNCPRVVIRQETSPVSLVASCCHRNKAWFLGQPIGPRKLADALVTSRARFHDGTGDVTEVEIGESAVSSPDLEAVSGPISPLVADPDFVFGSLKSKANGGVLSQPINAVIQSSTNGTEPMTDVRPLPVILIVDDNQINIQILTAYMSRLNHPHRSATNGQEALDMYTKAPGEYKCILTDISMPGMDGLESTRQIRKFERKRKLDRVTVITLTGLSGPDIEHEANASGVDLFLTRPLKLQGLVDALRLTGVVKEDADPGTAEVHG